MALSARLEARIRDAIAAAGGRIGFDAFMQMALYEPGLGYYVNGLRKFGPGGDFTTAPERSPLFARTLARQVAQVLRAMPGGEVLEFGPGSGALAADLLAELDALGCAPARYRLLELSADLQQRQRAALAARVPHLVERVAWLTQLPDAFSGVAIANEVLDAMPVRRFCVLDGGLAEQYVAVSGDGLALVQEPPQDGRLAARVADLDLPVGYMSELNLAAEAWVRAARAHPGELVGIAVGPLTNLALALRAEPALPTLLRRLVIMGGAFDYRGNTTAVAEWNVSVDPEAAAEVFTAWSASGLTPPTVLGLNLTEHIALTPTLLTRLGAAAQSPSAPMSVLDDQGTRSAAANPLIRVLEDALRFYFEFHFDQGEGYLAHLHDPVPSFWSAMIRKLV